MGDTQQENDGRSPEHGHGVKITVNGNVILIHRGHQTVTHIKHVGGVANAEELEEIINGVLTPLNDDGAVTIKGGEVFISHVRASAGS